MTKTVHKNSARGWLVVGGRAVVGVRGVRGGGGQGSGGQGGGVGVRG